MTTGATVMLLDLSGSMDNFVGTTGKTRRDVLQQALANVLPRHPGVQLFAFGSDVARLNPQQPLPGTMGGTDLTLALNHARQFSPASLLVITDGEPSDSKSALTAALMLNCEIKTIYCGEETNTVAISFLRALVRCSRTGTIGVAKVVSLEKPEDVADQLVLQLAGPAR
jgi:hypothetical protein